MANQIVNTSQALIDEAKKKYGEQAYNQSVAGKTVNVAPIVQPTPGLTIDSATGAPYVAPANVPSVPPTVAPVPGSASSILGTGTNEADQFAQQLASQNQADYNQSIDPQAIYNEKLKQSQAQIDALNAVYQDQINQARLQGQGRLGSQTAMQARGGLLGSDFGTAQVRGLEQANQNDINEINRQKSLELQALYSGVRQSAEAEKAAKEKAKKEGGDAYLAFLQGKQERKKQLVTDSASKLLSLGIDPNTISDTELKGLGIDRNDLNYAYQQAESAFAAASNKSALENAKSQAEINKLNQEITKSQADVISQKLKDGQYRTVGDFIYDANNNLIGSAKAVKRAIGGGGGIGGISNAIGGAAPVSQQPGFKKLKAPEQKQALALDNLTRELNKYKEIIDKADIGSSGVELYGTNAGLIESQLNALLFAAAQAEGTGALQAADRAVLEKVIPNPTTLEGAYTSLKTGGLEGVYSKIDNQIRKYNANLKNLGITPTSDYQLQSKQTENKSTVPVSDADYQAALKLING